MTQSRHKTLKETKERTPKDQLVKSLSQLGYLGQGLNSVHFVGPSGKLKI